MNEPAGNDTREQRSKICSTPFMLSLKVCKKTEQTGQGEIQAKMCKVKAMRSSFKILFAILAMILLFLFLFSTISPELQLQQNTTGSTLYYCVVVFFIIIWAFMCHQ